MSSGMGLDNSVVEEFCNMKLKKNANKIMTFKIVETKIMIDQVSSVGTLDELKKLLPDKECRYAVFDARKIHFILWTPTTATVKDKMIYSSSKEAIHKHLDGVQPVAFSAHDKPDLEELAI